MSGTNRDSNPGDPVVDFYRLLRIPTDADYETLRAAYRREARRHHPDAGGEAFYMIALNKAYGVLRDPGRRRAYDRQLGVVRTPAAAPPPCATYDVSTPAAPVGRASGSVLDFGRYTGWSIGQLAAHDPEYLLWLERTPIGRPLQPEIRATLGGRSAG